MMGQSRESKRRMMAMQREWLAWLLFFSFFGTLTLLVLEALVHP
jgi:hypothetical protein